MKDKLRDTIETLKTSRRARVFGILGVLALGILYIKTSGSSVPPHPVAQQKPKPQANLSTGSKEFAQELLNTYGEDIKRLHDDVKKTNEDLQDQRDKLKDYESRTAAILNNLLNNMSSSSTNTQQVNSGGAAPADTTTSSSSTTVSSSQGGMVQPISMPVEEQELESFGENTSPAVAPPPPPGPKKIAFIGAGDSVRLKLLAGVNAPTDGTPYPVVFKLASDVYGPDGSALPLGEARIVAAAQGSMTDSRALFRLTSMNIRFPNGKRKVVDVDGWVVGEDGIRGMGGVVIDPIGKAIAATAFSGSLSGLGTGISQANSFTRQFTFSRPTVDPATGVVDPDTAGQTDTIVTGNLLEFAAGRGLQGATREYSDMIRERLQGMVPIVQVLSGREATAVFAKSVSIEGLLDAMEDDDVSGHSSLD